MGSEMCIRDSFFTTYFPFGFTMLTCCITRPPSSSSGSSKASSSSDSSAPSSSIDSGTRLRIVRPTLLLPFAFFSAAFRLPPRPLATPPVADSATCVCAGVALGDAAPAGVARGGSCETGGVPGEAYGAVEGGSHVAGMEAAES